jgi:hypothetical protein
MDTVNLPLEKLRETGEFGYPGKDSPQTGHRLLLVAVPAQSEQSVPPQCLHLIETSDSEMVEPHDAHFAMVSPDVNSEGLSLKVSVRVSSVFYMWMLSLIRSSVAAVKREVQ